MNFLSKLPRASITLSSGQFLRGQFWRLPQGTASYRQSSIKLKIIPAPAIIPKTYIRKNEDLKRELSPHLTIYKPQLTSMMSITLRMTGFALAIMLWTVAITSYCSDHNIDYFVNELKALEVSRFWWNAAKVVLVFPFSYHFVAGMRHLFFDTGKLMEIKQFYVTGYVAIVLSCLLAVVLGMLGNTAAAEDMEEKTS